MDFRSLPHNVFLAGLSWEPSMTAMIGPDVRLVASHDGKVTLSFKGAIVSCVEAQDDILNVVVSQTLEGDATPDQGERWNNYVRAVQFGDALRRTCPHAVRGRFASERGQRDLNRSQADRLYGCRTMRTFDLTCKLFKEETGLDILWWGDHQDGHNNHFGAMIAPGVEVRIGNGLLGLSRWRPPRWVGSGWTWEPTTGPVLWGDIEAALHTLIRSSWANGGWKIATPPMTKLETKWT